MAVDVSTEEQIDSIVCSMPSLIIIPWRRLLLATRCARDAGFLGVAQRPLNLSHSWSPSVSTRFPMSCGCESNIRSVHASNILVGIASLISYRTRSLSLESKIC